MARLVGYARWVERAAALSQEVSFDPAAERDSAGRTKLQTRLGVWGKIVSLTNVPYWFSWWLFYYGPSGNQREAAQIAPVGLLVMLTFGALWALGRSRPLSLPVLKALDVTAHALMGVTLCLGLVLHPGPPMGGMISVFATSFTLYMRAVLVPSRPMRTLLVDLLLCVPTLIVAYVQRDRVAPAGVSPMAYWATFVTWCTMSCIACAIASRILYGLVREVRDARRLGQYILHERIGEGGMGVVYRASHALLRRPTAIKLMSGREPLLGARRFEQEVQRMAELGHPNIVTVHDYGRTSEGDFYYAMELLAGLDLERLVRSYGAQPAERVVHVLLQATRGLSRAHVAGLVHRDIKPANMFLCSDWGDPDTLKLLDFGLVKDLRAPDQAGVSQEGDIVGTPFYMGPEAVTNPGVVDARVDLYALGAVGYFLVSGEPPFTGRTVVEIVAHHIHSLPRRLGGRVAISEEFEGVLMRCLSKEPEARFPSADALRDALTACPEAGHWSLEQASAFWRRHAASKIPGLTTLDGLAAPFLDTVQVQRDWDSPAAGRS